ncbi:hypothetical protein M0R45_027323 [Rubus argutus]|uniref:Uncharacterized protein n=1 Tax=Rubus argutus TaxID=59490 RepID=A0AAW1X0W4_RUBAR
MLVPTDLGVDRKCRRAFSARAQATTAFKFQSAAAPEAVAPHHRFNRTQTDGIITNPANSPHLLFSDSTSALTCAADFSHQQTLLPRWLRTFTGWTNSHCLSGTV